MEPENGSVEQGPKTIDEWIQVRELKEGDIHDGTAVYGYGEGMDSGDYDGLVIRSIVPPPSFEVLEDKFEFVDMGLVSMVEQESNVSTEQGGDIGAE